MTFTPTNRPVPSDAPEDLYYNSSTLDALINGPAVPVTDRTGVARKSWALIEAENAGLGPALLEPDGTDRVRYGNRLLTERLGDVISVRDYITTAIDGSTSNQAGILAAEAAAKALGAKLLWPAGTYVSDSALPDHWDVEHVGPGVLKRGTTLYKFSQYGNQTNQIFISPGVLGGDGLASTQPFGSISAAVAAMGKIGRLNGRWQVIGTGGSYNEAVVVPDGLAQTANFLEFKFPSSPGVRTDPNSWPVDAATLDGTGLSTLIGFNTGRYNKIYIEYLRIQNFYNPALAATQQVTRGLAVDKFSFLSTFGCSYVGNGFANFSVLPDGSMQVIGGHLRGARYSTDNTAGRLSLTANTGQQTVIEDPLEYGNHTKHQASTVIDLAEFINCGKTPAAVSYGAALFAYKPGASIDTRGCVFKRNNYVYNIRGGMIAGNPGDPDIFGTGADANTNIWLIKGFGSDDLLDYQAQAGRDISQGFGGGTVTGVTTALAFDTNTSIPAAYLTRADQGLRIKIYAANGAGGTAQLRPSMVTTGGTRYELGNFQLAAGVSAKIELEVYVSSGGTVATVYYENIGATLGGTSTGQIIVNPIPFATESLELQIWGDTTSTNVLTIRKARMERWG